MTIDPTTFPAMLRELSDARGEWAMFRLEFVPVLRCAAARLEGSTGPETGPLSDDELALKLDALVNDHAHRMASFRQEFAAMLPRAARQLRRGSTTLVTIDRCQRLVVEVLGTPETVVLQAPHLLLAGGIVVGEGPAELRFVTAEPGQ